MVLANSSAQKHIVKLHYYRVSFEIWETTLNNKTERPKLRRNIKIHGELVVVNSHSPRIHNVCSFMIVGTSGKVHDPFF